MVKMSDNDSRLEIRLTAFRQSTIPLKISIQFNSIHYISFVGYSIKQHDTVDIHTYIHTYIQTYIHSSIHTYIHTYIDVYIAFYLEKR